MIIAKVAVRKNGSLGNPVVSHGDSLATESVMLSRAILVKDLGGHGDEGGVGVDVLEVGADAASARLTERVVALLSVSKLKKIEPCRLFPANCSRFCISEGAAKAVAARTAATRWQRVAY